MAYERLTQSLTQASYAKSYTSVLRKVLYKRLTRGFRFFLSPQALCEPCAGPLRGCSLLYRSPWLCIRIRESRNRIFLDVFFKQKSYTLLMSRAHMFMCMFIFLCVFVYIFGFVHIKLIVNKRGRRRRAPLISPSILYEQIQKYIQKHTKVWKHT